MRKPTLAEEAAKAVDALNELFLTICYELKIDILVGNLTAFLKRINKP